MPVSEEKSENDLCTVCHERPKYFKQEVCLKCLAVQRQQAEEQNLRENPEPYMLKRGFPKRFIRWQMSDMDAIYQRELERYKKSEGLYIHGGKGSGKTCWITVFAKELTRAGVEVWFKNVADLMFEIKGTFDRDARIFNDYELISLWATKPVLILDDMGAEKVSEYVRQSLYTLINKRYLEELPTYITSNLDLDELGARSDQRIASRLVEMCEMVDFGNTDLRIKKKAERKGGK